MSLLKGLGDTEGKLFLSYSKQWTNEKVSF